MKKNNLIIPFLIVFIMALFVVFLFLKNNKADKPTMASVEVPVENKNSSSSIIFFYGNTCPHCAKVEKFFEEENIRSKINFQSLEVYQNKDNANLMIQKAEACGLKPEELGVPFLYDSGKCLIGDTPIIDYFKNKISSSKS